MSSSSSILLHTARFAAFAPRPAVAASRAFRTSSARALNETHNHPDQAAENEKHKQDQLKKQKEGKGHWTPELASSSEEAITAERNHKGESIEELQEKTKSHAEEKHN